MTDEELKAIEERHAKSRPGTDGFALHATDIIKHDVPAMLAEIRRLRAMESQLRAAMVEVEPPREGRCGFCGFVGREFEIHDCRPK